ncbi:hypothetical protein [Actinomadura chokoriensis]|uniref:Uncharacterized protein n=1 Tax=Actinomadura chokoriensis TaxID=454156 RepID=A0ABV4QUU6_9ACTN
MSDNSPTMPSPRDAPGLWDFQLRILSGMRGNDAMVKGALRDLGAGQADMIAARERTEHIFLPAGRFENAAALLGTPVTSQTIQPTPAGVADDASPDEGHLRASSVAWAGLLPGGQGPDAAPGMGPVPSGPGA